MNKSKHTPGRWRVAEDVLGGIRVRGGSDDDTIAVVYCRTPPAEETANAKLIATAPKLLAALKAFVDVNKRCGYEFDSNEPAIYKLIADAVAEAEQP